MVTTHSGYYAGSAVYTYRGSHLLLADEVMTEDNKNNI